jgi:hypothetical protein
MEYKMNSNKNEVALLEYSVWLDAGSTYSLYDAGLYDDFENEMTVKFDYALCVEVYADASISGGDVSGGIFLGRYYTMITEIHSSLFSSHCIVELRNEYWNTTPPTISYIPSVTGFKTFIVKILTSAVNTVNMKIDKIVLKKVSP